MKENMSLGSMVCWVLAGLCLLASVWGLADAFAIRTGAADAMSSPQQMRQMTVECASAIFYLVPAVGLWLVGKGLAKRADAKRQKDELLAESVRLQRQIAANLAKSAPPAQKPVAAKPRPAREEPEVYRL